jgi:hypothetical protein
MLICVVAAFYAAAARSIPPEKIRDLALGENDAKVDAIAALVPRVKRHAPLLQALADGESRRPASKCCGQGQSRRRPDHRQGGRSDSGVARRCRPQQPSAARIGDGHRGAEAILG